MKQNLLTFLLCGILLIGVSYAQNRQVSGKVTSATDGSALSGVSVTLVGTNIATQTNNAGEYVIDAPNDGSLRFTYVGFQRQDLQINNKTVINVVMTSDAEALDEIVVVGYGSGTNMSTVVGSVSKVSSKDLEGRPTANALESLQGKVAGLQVYTSSGEPSATQEIRLHGVGSLGASSTPLFVLDGVPVSHSSIVSMNPEDFESVTVLKDASATSIYGSRAANGVIYFTTKKGKRGERASIRVRSQLGVSNLASTKMQESMMNTEQLLSFWEEAEVFTPSQVKSYRDNWGHNDTKWYKFYLKENTPLQQHDLSASGGSEKTSYFLSTSYFDQEGLMYRSGFDRITLRSNIDSRLNDWVRVGLNLGGSYGTKETNGWGTNNLSGGLSSLAAPFYTPYDENGNEYYEEVIPGWGARSPKYLADKMPSPTKTKHFNPMAYIEITPVEGLTLKTQGGMDYEDYRVSSRILPSYLPSLGNGEGSEAFYELLSRTITNTAEYKFQLEDAHRFAVLAGHEYTDYRMESFSGSSKGMTDDRLTLLPAGPNDRSVDQSITEYAYNSFFGRVSYDYVGKYFFDATVRQDASSRFGKDNRNATFWSLGGMWNIYQESFMNDLDWLTDAKLRASIGTSGNSEIGNYTSLALVGSSIYNGGTSWGISNAGNPHLAWEKQKKATVGLSLSFINRIHLDLEYYNRKTTNMLMDVPYPYTSGYDQIKDNVGALTNQGLDLNFSADIFREDDFSLTPYFNFSYNKQKITELFQGRDNWIIPNTFVSYSVGSPVMFFAPIQAGVNPETGNMEWYVPGDDIGVSNQDPNNVTTEFNEAALQQNTGYKRYAPFTGGFGLNSTYKGFSLDAFFSFSQGKYLFNNDMYFFHNPYQFAGYNTTTAVLDYWKEPGDIARFPKGPYISEFDTGLLENASFLRLKTLSIGYSLPKSVLQKTNFFTSAKVFYMGRNLFTATKYLGPDPEVDSNLTVGVNPNTKQSVFGIELTF